MRVKKQSINITLAVIALSLALSVTCWHFRDNSVLELCYVLFAGVFGSGCATLWLFIYEYRREKYDLLKAIFDETVELMENNTVFHLHRRGIFGAGVKNKIKDRPYIPPAGKSTKDMKNCDLCHYELCRFSDAVLEIGADRVKHICDMVDSVDFWSDGFRKKNKYRDAMRKNISMPLYEVFITAPAMEDGYIFRIFKGYKESFSYTTGEIYDLALGLDRDLHGIGKTPKYSWQKEPHHDNLGLLLHEKMWIFRDAFYSPYVSKENRRLAKKVFIKGGEYPYIR